MTPVRIAGLESGRNQRPLFAHCPFCGQEHVALLMKESVLAEVRHAPEIHALLSGSAANRATSASVSPSLWVSLSFGAFNVKAAAGP